MKYIDADRLRAVIKREIRLEELNFAALGGGEQTLCINAFEWVLKQIDSLQQEQPDNARTPSESEIDAFFKNWDQNSHGAIFDENGARVSIETVKNVVRQFLHVRKGD